MATGNAGVFLTLAADARRWVVGVKSARDALGKTGDSAKSTAQRFTELGNALTGAGRTMTMFVTAPLVGLGLAVGKLGMDAAETRSLVATSFGDMTGDIERWAETSSAAITQTSLDIQEQAATMFNIASSMGVARDEAFKLSTQLVETAADFSSFYNISTDVAFSKIQSAIVGEYEPLKQLGIVLNEATIKQQAYKDGIAELGAELTDQQKVQARFNAMIERAGPAIGDVERTADSAANKLRAVTADIREMGQEAGEASVPMITDAIEQVLDPLVKKIKQLADWYTEATPAQQQFTLGVIGVAAAAGPTLLVLGSMAHAISAIATAAPLAVKGVTALATAAGLNLAPWLLAARAQLAALGTAITTSLSPYLIAARAQLAAAATAMRGLAAAALPVTLLLTAAAGIWTTVVTAVRDYNKSIDDAAANAEKYGKKAQDAKARLAELSKQLDEGAISQEEYERSAHQARKEMELYGEATMEAAMQAQRSKLTWSEFGEDLKKIAGDILTAWEKTTTGLPVFFRTMWTVIYSATQRWLQETWGFISGTVADIWGSISTLATDVSQAWSDLWSGIKTTAETVFGEVAQWIIDRVSEIGGKFAWLWRVVYGGSYWPDMWEGILETARQYSADTLTEVKAFTAETAKEFEQLSAAVAESMAAWSEARQQALDLDRGFNSNLQLVAGSEAADALRRQSWLLEEKRRGDAPADPEYVPDVTALRYREPEWNDASDAAIVRQKREDGEYRTDTEQEALERQQQATLENALETGQQYGSLLAEGLIAQDWSGLANEIGRTLSTNVADSVSKWAADMFSGTDFGGLGAGLLGGLAGGVLGMVFSGFGKASNKADPRTNTYRVEVQNWPKQLESGASLMPALALRSSVTITVNAGNADARNIARSLGQELNLT